MGGEVPCGGNSSLRASATDLPGDRVLKRWWIVSATLDLFGGMAGAPPCSAPDEGVQRLLVGFACPRPGGSSCAGVKPPPRCRARQPKASWVVSGTDGGACPIVKSALSCCSAVGASAIGNGGTGRSSLAPVADCSATSPSAEAKGVSCPELAPPGGGAPPTWDIKLLKASERRVATLPEGCKGASACEAFARASMAARKSTRVSAVSLHVSRTIRLITCVPGKRSPVCQAADP